MELEADALPTITSTLRAAALKGHGHDHLRNYLQSLLVRVHTAAYPARLSVGPSLGSLEEMPDSGWLPGTMIMMTQAVGSTDSDLPP